MISINAVPDLSAIKTHGIR